MTSNLNIKKLAAAALIGLAITAAQAQTSPATTSTPASAPQTMQGMKHGDMAGMDKSGMKNMMKDMNDKMAAMPMSGNLDIDFARMMKIHHQGAIDMSIPEAKDGKSPAMRKLARDIIDAQKNEIAILDKFLAKSAPQNK
ncbi:hypothetical protein HC248_03007 [Polaromonas vacuolata]|uniref:DUF305 domain-containing protein n=1 Tax=Polaromonas vacuolata TaxID=37448 RepID=A0A6H2HD40_9BURK|nr:DUF305 domain-containing protein [Polaromonas vacuolata]QJC57677.1 hypothetical protein HC248_03007 [Polaromonas vacuolata]